MSTIALLKRQTIARQKKTGKAQRKFSAQQKSILNSFIDSIVDLDKLDFSPITDTLDPTSTITKSLARLHEFTASSDSFDYLSLKPSLPTSVIGGDMPVGSENSGYQSHFNENATFQNFNDTLFAPVTTQRNQLTDTHSQPKTDLRMDWVDACSFGRLPSLNHYCLLILDKNTEYWATYNRKPQGTGTPIKPLKQCITTTGCTPR